MGPTHLWCNVDVTDASDASSLLVRVILALHAHVFVVSLWSYSTMLPTVIKHGILYGVDVGYAQHSPL